MRGRIQEKRKNPSARLCVRHLFGPHGRASWLAGFEVQEAWPRGRRTETEIKNMGIGNKKKGTGSNVREPTVITLIIFDLLCRQDTVPRATQSGRRHLRSGSRVSDLTIVLDVLLHCMDSYHGVHFF